MDLAQTAVVTVLALVLVAGILAAIAMIHTVRSNPNYDRVSGAAFATSMGLSSAIALLMIVH